MSNIKRRAILVGVPFGLAGCSVTGNTPSPNNTVSTWAQYAAALAGGLANAVASVASVTGLSASDAATIRNDLGQIMNFATVVGQATDPAKAKPLALQIEQILNGAVAVAASIPVLQATPVGMGIAAAEVVLPLLEAAINQALGIASATATPPRSRLIPSMTPQAGLAYLQTVART